MVPDKIYALQGHKYFEEICAQKPDFRALLQDYFMPPERVLRLKLESGEFQNLRATQKSGPLPRKKVSLGKAGGAAGMAPKKAKPRAAAKSEAKDLCKEVEGCIPPHAKIFWEKAGPPF